MSSLQDGKGFYTHNKNKRKADQKNQSWINNIQYNFIWKYGVSNSKNKLPGGWTNFPGLNCGLELERFISILCLSCKKGLEEVDKWETFLDGRE